MATALSVVLCTYNRAERVGAALDALLRQKGDVEYEIVVIDNNSTDDTENVVRSIAASGGAGRVRYVFEGRQGLSHARNCGIRASHAPIVAFTDDDVRVNDD